MFLLYIDFPYRYSSLVYNNPEADIVNILTTEYHMAQRLLGLETWGRSLLLFQHTTTSASIAPTVPTSSTASTSAAADLREPYHASSLVLPLTSSDPAHSHVPEDTEITHGGDATTAVIKEGTSSSKNKCRGDENNHIPLSYII